MSVKIVYDKIVSVQMVTYNHSKFIADAIKSVLIHQTDFDYELIIGEDHSKDSTLEICNKYAKQHKRKIKLLQ